ncbi:MAG: tRNA(Ile)-lysidine synthase [Jatrophihabitans sp.]|nr:tRNA(Ile)-lysidine synthase [Jatrophihabitans sp.]
MAQLRRAVRAALTGSSRQVFVACSGGADSLALAAALAFEAPRAGVSAGLVTVDHGLQPGSSVQAARVAALGYELGLDPVENVTVSVSRTGGPEAAARSARYAALDSLATAWNADMMLGHTLDDQSETVLLGLGRGSGPRSIAGMRPRAGRYLRPLLGVRRATTVAACRALGFEPWDDPQNADPAFQRVRLRGEVLPLLEDVLKGGVAEALARTAAQLQDDLDALDELAASVISTPVSTPGREPGRVDHVVVASVAELPRALRTRVLRRWALDGGVPELGAGHLAVLEALIVDWHGQGPVDLPGGVRVARVSGRLELHRPDPS